MVDNEPHVIQIRGGVLGELLHQSMVRMPPMQTPPDVLQRVVSHIDRPGLLPLADLRYDALLATIKRLASARSIAPSTLAQVSLCHAQVLKGPLEDAIHFAPIAMLECDEPQFSIIIPSTTNSTSPISASAR
jgi:hypothetical protein